jgi:dsRNA-specific ribonuclease
MHVSLIQSCSLVLPPLAVLSWSPLPVRAVQVNSQKRRHLITLTPTSANVKALQLHAAFHNLWLYGMRCTDLSAMDSPFLLASDDQCLVIPSTDSNCYVSMMRACVCAGEDIAEEYMQVKECVVDMLLFIDRMQRHFVHALNIIAKPFALTDEQLKKIMDHENGPFLIHSALTHKSFAKAFEDVSSSYEQLEFLGDSLLLLAVSFSVASSHGRVHVDRQWHTVQSLTSNASLSAVAHQHEITSLLLHTLPKAALCGSSKILADVVESLAGAVFLSVGFRALTAFGQLLERPSLSPIHATLENRTATDDIPSSVFNVQGLHKILVQLCPLRLASAVMACPGTMDWDFPSSEEIRHDLRDAFPPHVRCPRRPLSQFHSYRIIGKALMRASLAYDLAARRHATLEQMTHFVRFFQSHWLESIEGFLDGLCPLESIQFASLIGLSPQQNHYALFECIQSCIGALALSTSLQQNSVEEVLDIVGPRLLSAIERLS